MLLVLMMSACLCWVILRGVAVHNARHIAATAWRLNKSPGWVVNLRDTKDPLKGFYFVLDSTDKTERLPFELQVHSMEVREFERADSSRVPVFTFRKPKWYTVSISPFDYLDLHWK
jgi:hypothetical protein